MQSEELSSVPVKLLTLLGVPVALEREDILEADEEVSQYLHDTMSGPNFMHRWQHYDELTELQIMCASTTSYVDEVETGLADILFRHFKAEVDIERTDSIRQLEEMQRIGVISPYHPAGYNSDDSELDSEVEEVEEEHVENDEKEDKRHEH